MARVTTLIYTATGRKSRTSTSSTPPDTGGQQTVIAPLLFNDPTIYAPEVVADGLVSLPLLSNTNTFYGAVVSAAAVFVSPPLLANTQVIFPPTVNQKIQLPLTSNAQTFYGPTVNLGQSVNPALLSNTNTLYGPQLNMRVDAPLLTNTSTAFSPSIVTGTSILPTLLSNSQAFYGPQLNLKVSPALVSNGQTFYSPTVAAGFIVRPSFWANGQAFYAPQVNEKVVAGFVTNSQTFYAPVLSTNALIVAPKITNAQTFYGPSLSLRVLAPLVTNTSSVYGPAVSTSGVFITVPTLTNTQTFYGEQINRNVKPSLLTNSQVFPPLTVGLANVPGQLLSTPGGVLTSSAGQAPQIDLTLNADHYAGYYLRIQRSSDGLKRADGFYQTQTLNGSNNGIVHQILAEEVAAGSITNPSLSGDGYFDPFGAWFQQYRIEREDGGSSAWVEFSGTVTAFVGAFSNTLKNPNISLSVDRLTMTSHDFGSNAQQTALLDTPLSNATGYIEFELLAGGTGSPPEVGIVDSAIPYGGFQAIKDYSRSAAIRTDGAYYKQGALQSVAAAGSKFGICVHKASKTVWFRASNGTWINGTPAFNADGTISASATGGYVLSTLADIYPAACGYRADSWRVNAGQSVFALGSVPTNCQQGWA